MKSMIQVSFSPLDISVSNFKDLKYMKTMFSFKDHKLMKLNIWNIYEIQLLKY